MVGGCAAPTVKNGAKWERVDKLMIKGDFFAFPSPVRPGLPDLSHRSLSREAGRLIQLRLAASGKWHGLAVISGVFSLISWWRWPGHGGVRPPVGGAGTAGEAGCRSGGARGSGKQPRCSLPRSLSRVLRGGDFLLISSFHGRKKQDGGGGDAEEVGGHRRRHLLEANECHRRSH